jgi:hypothetical protein
VAAHTGSARREPSLSPPRRGQRYIDIPSMTRRAPIKIKDRGRLAMRMAICVSLSAIIVGISLTNNVSSTETKRDIRGFYPEMTWAEFEKNIKSTSGISKYCTDLKQLRWHVLHENDLQCDIGNFPDDVRDLHLFFTSLQITKQQVRCCSSPSIFSLARKSQH